MMSRAISSICRGSSREPFERENLCEIFTRREKQDTIEFEQREEQLRKERELMDSLYSIDWFSLSYMYFL